MLFQIENSYIDDIFLLLGQFDLLVEGARSRLRKARVER